MKTNFKSLGLAAAVAAVTAGYAGVSAAQTVVHNSPGDLAIVPYYTVQENWGTGVHILNTSDQTQVVKLRFRRGSDSLGALNLNLILSPEDEWVGFLNDNGGAIRLNTQDTSCTAPLPTNGGWTMPGLYREGADEGYIEIISMGATATEGVFGEDGKVTDSLAWNAAHQSPVDGAPAVPRNCAYVEQNFLDGTVDGIVGAMSASLTSGPYDHPLSGDTENGDTNFVDGGNALKVSWFIRDAATGVEFGGDAEHVADFETSQTFITNQEFGVIDGNLRGFDFPDLNGGSPEFNLNGVGAGQTPSNKYNALRNALGVSAIVNDWSDNPGLNVGTDWIVTIPGQYVMLDLPEYLSSIANPEDNPCLAMPTGTDGCDQRDIPVKAEFNIWDREEQLLTAPDDQNVVVSPSELRYATNVIHWGQQPVMESFYDVEVDTSLLEQVSGWARLHVTSKADSSEQTQGICYWTVTDFEQDAADPNDLMDCAAAPEGKVPMLGFVAWERSFPQNPDGNYGRAVGHHFDTTSSN
jgi:hypothetical protein